MSQVYNNIGQKVLIVALLMLYGFSTLLDHAAVYPGQRSTSIIEQGVYDEQHVEPRSDHVILAEVSVTHGFVACSKSDPSLYCALWALLTDGQQKNYQLLATYRSEVELLLHTRYANLLFPFHVFW